MTTMKKAKNTIACQRTRQKKHCRTNETFENRSERVMPLFVRNARQKPQMARLEETGAKLLYRVHFPTRFLSRYC